MRNGLPSLVWWLLVTLFVLAGVSMLVWSLFCARDVMIAEEQLVAGRFDLGDSLRLTTVCFAVLAVLSGSLYFGHYRRVDHYGSPLDVFFRVAFAFSCGMAIICFLPSLGG